VRRRWRRFRRRIRYELRHSDRNPLINIALAAVMLTALVILVAYALTTR